MRGSRFPGLFGIRFVSVKRSCEEHPIAKKARNAMPTTPVAAQPQSPEPLPETAKYRNVIIHADALKALGDVPAGHIDLTVFSPPYDGIRDYGKNRTLNYKTLGSELFRATTDGGVCAVVIGNGTKDFAKSLTSEHHSGRRVHV